MPCWLLPGHESGMTLYEQLGGEAGVRRLVDCFYDLMETDPVVSNVRNLHPADLGLSRDKLFFYLSGWLGGPDMYVQKYGHPRLRGRHLPFSIGEAERDGWMRCMIQAMRQAGVVPKLRKELGQAFYQLADFMRNQESGLV
ncbi:MAG: group II truncated hemoglobin [Proteobacteria bacterium]|nr:group II truncated hemoglobin [Pseudomonadota bacterium]